MSIKTWLAVTAAAVATGCGTTTAPGAIGVTRPQLLLVPSATLNAQAAQNFARASSTARSAGQLNSDEATVRRVRSIANKLIKEVAVFRPDASAWAWEVNVFDAPVVNAFCAAGGKIGVNSGLLAKIEPTDDELAAVLGHEMAHALREHTREEASQRVLSSAVVQGIANSGSRNAGVMASAADVGSFLFVRLPFSREMELEADTMGLELMARAGFDPQAALTFWRKMQARSGASKGEFLSTHPSNDKRAGEIEAAIPKVMVLYEAAPRQQRLGVTSTSVATTGAARGQRGAGGTRSEVPMSAQATAQPVGQESFQVEQMARRDGCDRDASAVLTGKGPGYETYSLVCTAGNVWSVRCEFGNCRVIK